MTQEDKELLSIDLSARLPFMVSVKWKTSRNPAFLKNIDIVDEKLIIYRKYSGDIYAWECCIEDIKPYLRPMSSMTKEEEEEYHNLCYKKEREGFEFGKWAARTHYHDTIVSIDYLNSIHIDFRGLIEKGLAIEAPEGMYNTK